MLTLATSKINHKNQRMITPGRITTLPIIAIDEKEIFLGTEEDKILLHPDDVQSNFEIGQQLEVFVITTESGMKTGSRQLPTTQLNQASRQRVLNMAPAGAYVDIGAVKHILIPEEEMRDPLKDGQKVVMVLKYDFKNKKLYGSTRLGRYFPNNNINLQVGQQVNTIVGQKLPFGRKVVINNMYTGIIFRKDIMRPMRIGDNYKLYVKEISNEDITLVMQKIGEAGIDEGKQRIMDALENGSGYLRLNSNTDSEEIKIRLRISKNTFKTAATSLAKEGKVTLTKRGIKLIKKS